MENRVLRKIFGLKMEKVAGERRKLHNEELHSLGDQSKDVKMGVMGRREMHTGFCREM